MRSLLPFQNWLLANISTCALPGCLPCPIVWSIWRHLWKFICKVILLWMGSLSFWSLLQMLKGWTSRIARLPPCRHSLEVRAFLWFLLFRPDQACLLGSETKPVEFLRYPKQSQWTAATKRIIPGKQQSRSPSRRDLWAGESLGAGYQPQFNDHFARWHWQFEETGKVVYQLKSAGVSSAFSRV